MVEYSQRASDARVEFVELTTPSGVYDITKLMVAFDMYDSLYQKYTKIEITMNDSTNLPFAGPILGEEFLRFRFNTKSSRGVEDIEAGNCYVMKISDRYITGDRQQVYILNFVSQQAMHGMTSSISRSFDSKPISSIVETIYDEYLSDGSSNDITVEPSLGIENVVIPKQNPLQAIDWLSKRAVNANGAANYVFYETNGETYFHSIDFLLRQKVKQKFFYNPVSNDSTKLNALKNGVIEVDNLEILNNFDVAENNKHGYYASKLITHDIVTKKIEESTYGLDQVYDGAFAHTDSNMPISSSETDYTPIERHTFAPLREGATNKGDNVQSFFDSNVNFYPKHNQMFSRITDELYDNKVEDWYLQRKALMMTLDQIKLEVQCPGVAGLHIGDLIEIAVPSPQKVIKNDRGQITNIGDLNDFYLSGKYLVTSMNRNINFGEKEVSHKYSMTLELTKTGLGSGAGKRKSLL